MHMSDGCIATHLSDQPKMAWFLFLPSSAPHPEPGSRLLQGIDDFIKIRTAGTLVKVATIGCHIADLYGGRR